MRKIKVTLRLHLQRFLLLYKQIWTVTLQTVLQEQSPPQGLLRRAPRSPLFANSNQPASTGGAERHKFH